MCYWSMCVVLQEIDGYMKHAGGVVLIQLKTLWII